MLVFEERGKPEYPEKNLLEQGREPTTNSTYIWHQGRDLNPGHIGGRRAFFTLCHPCFLSEIFIWNFILNLFGRRDIVLKFINLLINGKQNVWYSIHFKSCILFAGLSSSVSPLSPSSTSTLSLSLDINFFIASAPPAMFHLGQWCHLHCYDYHIINIVVKFWD